MDLATKVLGAITEFYLGSRDFNGIPIRKLIDAVEAEPEGIREALVELVENDLARLIFIDADMNPHIVRTGFEPTENQLAKLKAPESPTFCCYPSVVHLASVVDTDFYSGKPYDLELALGEPQLAFRSFDLAVLESYRNDPRFYYDNDDTRGSIYYNSDDLADGDKALIQSFGFSYDGEMRRAVAVYLRYLSDLTPEHQGIWRTKELSGDYRLHPDYFVNTIIGDWADHVPICTALLKELYIINQMCEAMERPSLFREDFGRYGDDKPQRFGLLIRPTLEEFNAFVLTFDKMLSDNINKAFFKGEVPSETEVERKDGKIQVQRKGTLQMLDDWLRSQFRTDDWGPWDASIKALRKVRKLRQKPAHALDENVFDQQYFKKQRDLLVEAYNAVRTIRLMFANHPVMRTADIEIPSWLQEGKIRLY